MQLTPLPYHVEIGALLEQEMSDVWKWFSTSATATDEADRLRLELLKTTYRLDASSAERVCRLTQTACVALGVTFPVTLYQSQQPSGLNASLVPIPDHSHIVLHGPVTEVLDDHELLALLGHELSHQLLWTQWGGRYRVIHDILIALEQDPTAKPAHIESARMFRLYSEMFCDRGGLVACGSLHRAVATLVKTGTGLREVNPEGYLQQADEVLSAGPSRTEGYSHPECFIRAKALHLWSSEGPACEEKIRTLIEGDLSLTTLDLIAQTRLSALTRRVIDSFLEPEWMRTETTLGHARLFFHDYDWKVGGPTTESESLQLPRMDDSVRNYLCYVLLDFCTADRDLERAPLAAAIRFAEKLHIEDSFGQIARKECNLRKKQYEQLCRDAEQIIARQDVDATEIA